MPSIQWDAADYAANSSSQYAWACELISTLNLEGHETILDVGCGDGKITAQLAGMVPEGGVVGIDASAQMIDFARRRFALPNLGFQVMDARQIQLERRFDRVFSNAALHWVDDHEAFLRGAAACLRPGGRVVISCGGSGNAHNVFRAFCSEMRVRGWRPFFRGMKAPYFFYRPDDYIQWLPRAGFQINSVGLADKDLVFPTVTEFVAWLRTTWMPYTHRVPAEAREGFLSAVVDRYLSRHPADAEGVHVGMVRLEIDATKV